MTALRKPAISVIIPAFNARDHLTAAVASVLRQTCEDWEAIIISDDGHDYRRLLARQGLGDERLQFTSTSQPQSGRAAACNRGVQMARGESITFLDADDYFAATRLQQLVPAIRQYGVVVTNLKVEDAAGHALACYNRSRPDGWLNAQSMRDVLRHGNSVVGFHAARRVPALPEQYYLGDDVCYIYQLWDAIGPLYYLGEPTYHYVQRDGSISKGLQAAARFIDAKQRMIADIASGALPLHDRHVKAAALEFLTLSLAVERQYYTALEAGELVTFSRMLADYLDA